MEASGFTCPGCGDSKRQHVHQHHGGIPYRLSCHRCEHVWTNACERPFPTKIRVLVQGTLTTVQPLCELARGHFGGHAHFFEDGSILRWDERVWTWTTPR